MGQDQKTLGLDEGAQSNIVPFSSAEEAWFWYVQTQKALLDGARFTAGQSIYPRPCEPADIYRVIDRLYRNRRLKVDHLKILRHYGVRMLPPERHRVKEVRAHGLWMEAMARIEEVLIGKGIVRRSFSGVPSDLAAWAAE